MISDNLKNASFYIQLGPDWKKAFDFLEQCKKVLPEKGRYEIDGSQVFALVQQYETTPPENGRWEAHKNYVDIQCVLSGREKIGYAPAGYGLNPAAYNPEKDCGFFGDTRESVMLPLEEGQFAIFMPGEIHKPHCFFGEISPVNKVVIKIRILPI